MSNLRGEIEKAIAEERQARDKQYAFVQEWTKKFVEDHISLDNIVTGGGRRDASAQQQESEGLTAAALDRLDKVQAQVAQVSGRVDRVEQAITSSESRMASAMQSLLSSLEGRTGSLEATMAQCSEELASLRAVQQKAAKEMSDAQPVVDAAMDGRLHHLERLLNETLQKHGQWEIELVGKNTKFDKLLRRFTSCQDRLDGLEAAMNEAEGRHSQELEAYAAKHAQQAKELESTRLAHVRATSAQAELDDHHASLADRVAALEEWTDMESRRTADVDAQRARLDQTQARLLACEKHARELDDYHMNLATFTKEEKAGLNSHLQLLANAFDERAQEVESLRACVQKVGKEANATKDEILAIAQDHVPRLQEMLQDSMSTLSKKFDKELSAVRGEHGVLAGRLSRCEGHGAELEGSHAGLKTEAESRSRQHETLQQRVDKFGRVLEEATARHAREVDDLRSACAKCTKDLQPCLVAGTQQAVMLERLMYVEDVLSKTADEYSKDSIASNSKFERVFSRLAVCEAATNRDGLVGQAA